MIFLFENFAESRLHSGLSSVDTLLEVPAIDAGLFPEPSTAEHRFALVLYDGLQAPEIVWASSNPLTGLISVERGQEGTTAKNWRAGSVVINTPTKISLDYLASGGSDSWHQYLQDQINEAMSRIEQETVDRNAEMGTLRERVAGVALVADEAHAMATSTAAAFIGFEQAWAMYQIEVNSRIDEADARSVIAANTAVSAAEASASLKIFVEAALGDDAAAFAEKIETLVTEGEAQVSWNTDMTARVGAAEGAIEEEAFVRATETGALAGRTSSLEVEMAQARGGESTLKGRIDTVENVAATATGALASKTETVLASLQASGNFPAISVPDAHLVWTQVMTTPNGTQSIPLDPSRVYVVAGEGQVLRFSGAVFIGPNGAAKLNPTGRYRLLVRLRRTINVSAGTNNVAFAFRVWSPDGLTNLGNTPSQTMTPVLNIADGWVNLVSPVRTGAEILQSFAGAGLIRPMLRGGSSGTAVDHGEIEISSFVLVDEALGGFSELEARISSEETARVSGDAANATRTIELEASQVSVVNRSNQIPPIVGPASRKYFSAEVQGSPDLMSDLPTAGWFGVGVGNEPFLYLDLNVNFGYVRSKMAFPRVAGGRVRFKVKVRSVGATARLQFLLRGSDENYVGSSFGVGRTVDIPANSMVTLVSGDFITDTQPAPNVYLRPQMRALDNNIEVYLWEMEDVAATEGLSARVTSTEQAIANADGLLASWKKSTTVPGAEAFIEAVARASAGSAPYSSVGIGAKLIALWNQSGGVWRKAVEVQGGDAIFTGGLNVGTYLRLGSGQGWPVALASQRFTAGDGAAISFGTNLGSLPNYTMVMDNLLPLGAGETYNIRLINLTATGATMSAKINVPAAPTSVVKTDDYASGTGPARQMLRGSNAESDDGTYTFRISVTHRGRFYDLNMEPGSWAGTITLGIWAQKSGVWSRVSSYIAHGFGYGDGSSSGFKNYYQTDTYSTNEMLGSGVTGFGVSIDSWGGDNGTGAGNVPSLNDLVSVAWNIVGAGAGIRTALAANAKTTVIIQPKS